MRGLNAQPVWRKTTSPKRVGVALLLIISVVALAWWRINPALGNLHNPNPPARPPSSAPGPTAEQVSPAAGLSRERQGTWISGTAREAGTETPVEGVSVKVYNEKTDKIVECITDARGEYALPVMQNVDLMFIVDARRKGWQAIPPEGFRLHENEQRTGVEIIVRQNTGSIAGTVYTVHRVWHPDRIGSVWPAMAGKNPRQGEKAFATLQTEETLPLPGARVLLAHPGDHIPPDLPEAEATTDATGHYRFDDLPPGEFLVFAATPPEAVQYRDDRSPAGQQKITLGVAEQREDVDLRLDMDGVTVVGRVLDTSGRPLPGATITAMPHDVVPPDGDDGFDRITTKELRAVANENGNYRMPGLCPANWQETGGFMNTRVLPSKGRTYQLKAQAPGFATAYILLPALQYDTVEFTKAFLGIIAQQPETADELKAFDPAKLQLPVATGNLLTGIDFVLEPACTIGGRVVDTTGKALPKVRLQFIPNIPPEPQPFKQTLGFPKDSVETAEDGAFLIPDMSSGTYEVIVDDGHGFQLVRNNPFQVSLFTAYEAVEVIIESQEERGNIEGTVVTGGGRPVANFQATVTEVQSPGESHPRRGEFSRGQAQGTFLIQGISAGIATVDFKSDGYADEVLQVEVQGGRTTALRVEMKPEALLRGRVTRNGEPAANANIALEELPDKYASTDANGTYEIKGIPEGHYLLNFSLWLYEDERGAAQVCERRAVEVKYGQETRGDLDYMGDATLTGRFEGKEGTDWKVVVNDESLPGSNKLRAGTWKFRKNSQYEIFDLPPGTYTVEGICSSRGDSDDKKTKTITLTAGETATQDFLWR